MAKQEVIQFKDGTPNYIVEAGHEYVRLDQELKEINDEATAVRKERRKIKALLDPYLVGGEEAESDDEEATE